MPRTTKMICNPPFRRLLRSCRRFLCRYIGIHYIMATLDKIKEAVAALDLKVTAHLDADGAAVLEMLNKNAALQADNDAKAARIAELEALLAGAGGITDEDVAGVASLVDAVGARL